MKPHNTPSLAAALIHHPTSSTQIMPRKQEAVAQDLLNCLSDHFEAEYGWRVTDTRHLRARKALP